MGRAFLSRVQAKHANSHHSTWLSLKVPKNIVQTLAWELQGVLLTINCLVLPCHWSSGQSGTPAMLLENTLVFSNCVTSLWVMVTLKRLPDLLWTTLSIGPCILSIYLSTLSGFMHDIWSLEPAAPSASSALVMCIAVLIVTDAGRLYTNLIWLKHKMSKDWFHLRCWEQPGCPGTMYLPIWEHCMVWHQQYFCQSKDWSYKSLKQPRFKGMRLWYMGLLLSSCMLSWQWHSSLMCRLRMMFWCLQRMGHQSPRFY